MNLQKSVVFCTLFWGLLSILMLSACRQSPTDPVLSKLSGDWEITAAEHLLRKLGEAPSLDPEPATEGDGESRMMLQFFPDGNLKTTTRLGRFDPPPKEGRWKLLAWNELQQTMEIECSIAGQVTQHEVQFIEPDLIELVPPNLAGTNSKLRFRRVK